MSGEGPLDLGRFLKLHGWAQSGGEAKRRIQAGEVKVNGEIERRRGRKLERGDRIEMGEKRLTVE
jgi:ribosome-associated protein